MFRTICAPLVIAGHEPDQLLKSADDCSNQSEFAGALETASVTEAIHGGAEVKLTDDDNADSAPAAEKVVAAKT